MRLRTSLFLMAFGTALPLIAFALLAANLVVRQENESLLNAAKARNRAVMSAVDGEVGDAMNTLRALAVTPSLEANDLQGFYVLGKKVLATQPSWNNLLVHDADGRQLVNESLPWGSPLLSNPVAPASIAQAVATGRPAVGDLTVAPLLQNRLGIPIRVPVMRDGRAVYVLTAVLEPAAFQRLLAQQDLPREWVSGLVDGQGRLIARVPRADPGSMASQDYLSQTSGGAREGWYRGSTLEGVDTYTAFLRSDLTGWTIGYALPAAIVTGGSDRVTWLMSAGVLLSLASAAAIGLWLSRRIAKPMSELAAAAVVLASGSVAPRVESTMREVSLLSDALDRSAHAIAERDRNLLRSHEELRNQAAELRRADTNRSQFLALLAHELRNPLAPLRTGVAILSMHPDAKRAADTRAMMERQVAHMARLIDDLIDVSRIDRGVLELRRELVAVDSVVRSAVETAKPGLEAKQQQLVVRYAAEPLYVDGDSLRLSQVAANLLNNACKFTPPGGHVEIATRVDGDEVVLTVTDDGVGFTDADRHRMFDMFVQLDESRNHSTGGLGIGLTLVRSIVGMHGGRIDAQSDGPGKGATFTVHLPKASTEAAPAALAAVPRLPTSRARVLVVDDNVDAAASLAAMLRLHGFDVFATYSGAQAMEAARSFKPEVAFIDLNMPGMSGIELAAALRADPSIEAIRLVALTGMGQKSDLAETRRAGFEAHLTKPAQPEEIVRVAAGERDNVVPIRAERS
jgi:signal transduction histidine kinase/CheY-like chemotaxis protein